ncbi:MAG: hypothetical protein ACFFDB_00290 [Promethearchaeota archaeon]
MKAIRYLNLTGSSLLTIADKHVKKNGKSLSLVLDENFGRLIEDKFPDFVKKVSDANYEFPPFSGVGAYYKKLLGDYKKALVKGTEFKVE